MITVIIAGGSGTRLWPLSTPEFPKHLLAIGDDSSSLLQNTYMRATTMASEVYVVSEAGHIEYVRAQLPELPADHFIVEPARRGTANCILLALAQIAKTHDADEPVAFIHADHFIRDNSGFMHSFQVATDMVKTQHRIVLVGVEPDYPATGFGYIQKGDLVDEARFVYAVELFKEKPDFAVAQSYLQSGQYLWNCGYFVGSVAVFTAKMERFAPELLQDYQRLVQTEPANEKAVYLQLESQAIDYALIEKVTDLLVVPASFDWMDVGSYADISKVVSSDEAGNYVAGHVELEETTNSYIENQEDKPVAVIGLDNCVVVNTPNGILVTRTDLSQKVGDVSKRFHK